MARWKGMREAQRNLAALERDTLRMFPRRLREEGEEIMTDVSASRPGKGVPRDTGNLANTGEVEGPSGPPTRPRVTLSFGGTAAKYGYRQHEDLTLRHTLGESRYLVRGVERRQAGGTASQALAEQLRALKGVA